MTIIAAADGSALGNPGPAGWGWYIDDQNWACGGWPHGTNNQGELMAVLDLLQQTANADDDLLILCDSKYVINSVTSWMPGWKRNGWKKKDGKPVLNVDLMKGIDDAMVGRTVRFEWVKGHAGHDLNEEADRLANGAATAYQAGGVPDAGPGFVAAGAPVERVETPVGQQAPQPDLFALLSEEAAPEPEPTLEPAPERVPTETVESPIEAAISGEMALLDPAVRSDPRRVSALLHPKWVEVGKSGRLYTRDEMLAEIGPLPEPLATEIVDAQQIDANTVLILWRTIFDESSALRSSIWVRRTTGAWVQRFHQGTHESLG